MNDSLTFVAGRFYSPIGFYSERIRLNWVIKTPDPPLMFNQVYPDQLSFDGLQLRGALPVRLAREAGIRGFVANGLSIPGTKLVAEGLLRSQQLRRLEQRRERRQGLGRPRRAVDPQARLHRGALGPGERRTTQAGQTLNLWDVDAN